MKPVDKKTARKTALILIAAFCAIAGVSFLVSLFLRGYRFKLEKEQISLTPTGLLVAASDPKGAPVYIDGKLATATDDTLTLSPKEYQIKIEKDGFLPWEKKITVKKEVVAQTNAVLFKNAPDLKPLTTTGAVNPTFSPDSLKIVYAVTKAGQVNKNGIWILELSQNLPLNKTYSRQIAPFIASVNWEESVFLWSPDGKTILLVNKKNEEITNVYLFESERFTALNQINDVSYRLNLILENWQKEQEAELKIKLGKLPEELSNIASSSAEMVTFSPDEERLFYLATKEATIPDNLIPHPPGRSTQIEERQIKPNNVYVYNLKEDTNFLIGSAENLNINPDNSADKAKKTNSELLTSPSPPPTSLYWLTPNHLLYIDKNKNEIKVVEADSSNRQTVYAGPFENGFVFPSPSEKSLIILTSLHSSSSMNLYEVKIR